MILLLIMIMASAEDSVDRWIRVRDMCENKVITRSKFLSETVEILQIIESERTNLEIKKLQLDVESKVIKQYTAKATCSSEDVN